jgi:hypothetical protein
MSKSKSNVVNLQSVRDARAAALAIDQELKAQWGDGPWLSEPDLLSWRDPATALPCMIARTPLGHLCGYVGVFRGHKAYGLPFDAVDARVHGGLTWGSTQKELEPRRSVGRQAWFFGFDCAHAGDLIPGVDTSEMKKLTDALLDSLPVPVPPGFRQAFERTANVYRTFDYVKAEVTDLAAQLHAMDIG